MRDPKIALGPNRGRCLQESFKERPTIDNHLCLNIIRRIV